jgi:hypothetical protein
MVEKYKISSLPSVFQTMLRKAVLTPVVALGTKTTVDTGALRTFAIAARD